MLSLTRKCDYALVAMAELARNGRRTISARGLAEILGIRSPVLTNVLHRLQRHGLVTSRKGARGGYALARPPGRITLADVIDAIEGEFRLTPCCDGTSRRDVGTAQMTPMTPPEEVELASENPSCECSDVVDTSGVATSECDIQADCRIRAPMQRVHRGLRTYFASVTVADLAFESGLVQIEIAGSDCEGESPASCDHLDNQDDLANQDDLDSQDEWCSGAEQIL